jgi:hypothetical protein
MLLVPSETERNRYTEGGKGGEGAPNSSFSDFFEFFLLLFGFFFFFFFLEALKTDKMNKGGAQDRRVCAFQKCWRKIWAHQLWWCYLPKMLDDKYGAHQKLAKNAGYRYGAHQTDCTPSLFFV